MKIIALDVDGVLNHRGTFAKQPGNNKCIDPNAVKRLRRIVDATGAKIVVSSTWRLFPDHLDALRCALDICGLPEDVIVGATPSKGLIDHGDGVVSWVSATRGSEIKAWLDEHPTDTFVILDDDWDGMAENGLLPRYIQTDFADGLQDEHVERAIALLNADPKPTPRA